MLLRVLTIVAFALIPSAGIAQDGAYLEQHPEYFANFPSVEQVFADYPNTAEKSYDPVSEEPRRAFFILEQALEEMSSFTDKYSEMAHAELDNTYDRAYITGLFDRISCSDLRGSPDYAFERDVINRYVPEYLSYCDIYEAEMSRQSTAQTVKMVGIGGIIALLLFLLMRRARSQRRKLDAERQLEAEALAKELADRDAEAKDLASIIASLPPEAKVRGVWESVGFDRSALPQGWKLARDTLDMHIVLFRDDTLFVVSSPVETWKKAVEGELPENLELFAKARIAEIDSVELQSSAELRGEKERQERVYIKGGRRNFEARHPYIHSEGEVFWYDSKRCSVVFAFTKEGDRIRLFQTYNRDLAVKWHKQVSNRLAAMQQHATPAQSHDDTNSDYM